MRRLIVGLLALPLLCGCFVNVKIPLDRDLDHTQLGSKVGEAHATSVLWMFFWGDAGTQAAARQGGITTINHADQGIFSVLFGIYATDTTIVYGD